MGGCVEQGAGRESEEEMDGGGGRDVRKLRVEEVFYGAIGKEPEQQKERDRDVKRKKKKKIVQRYKRK